MRINNENIIDTPKSSLVDVMEILDSIEEVESFLGGITIQDFDKFTPSSNIKNELHDYQKNLIEKAIKIAKNINNKSNKL